MALVTSKGLVSQGPNVDGDGRRSRLPRFERTRFDLDIAAEAPAVADVILFEQILTNLLLNAGDVARTIKVTLRLDGQHLRLEVHDDGPGIPAERRAGMFSAFETTKPDGLGLGLLSVRVATELQGGSIALDQSPLGGAQFIVLLPREPQSPTPTGLAPVPGDSASEHPAPHPGATPGRSAG